VPHLAAGLYLLIFGYFANAQLLKTVVGEDPLGPPAVDSAHLQHRRLAAEGRLM
jgi:hypothetical protein